MSQIRFTNAHDDTTIGNATLTDGRLDYDNPMVEGIMKAMVVRIGPEKAFRYFSGRSNGYVTSQLVAP